MYLYIELMQGFYIVYQSAVFVSFVDDSKFIKKTQTSLAIPYICLLFPLFRILNNTLVEKADM